MALSERLWSITKYELADAGRIMFSLVQTIQSVQTYKFLSNMFSLYRVVEFLSS